MNENIPSGYPQMPTRWFYSGTYIEEGTRPCARLIRIDPAIYQSYQYNNIYHDVFTMIHTGISYDFDLKTFVLIGGSDHLDAHVFHTVTNQT